MNKKLINALLSLIMISIIGCAKQDTTTNTNVIEDETKTDITVVHSEDVNAVDNYKFSAYVHEIHDTYILVTPIKTTTGVNISCLISIDLKHISDDSLPTLGDTYEITYDGLILETYPAQLHEIYEMKRVSVGSKIYDVEHTESSIGVVRPSVMIQGIVYYDTGRISDLENRDDVIHGTITSTIDSSKMPRENDQSNFGVDFRYQIYSELNRVELLLDDNQWHVFECKEGSNNTIKRFNESTNYKLYEIDEAALNIVLVKYKWTEGTADCLSDYELVIDNVRYVYHSDCGTINDITNQKSITLNDKDKEYVNGLLKQFVSERHWSSGPMQPIN